MADVGTLRWAAKKTARIGLALAAGMPRSMVSRLHAPARQVRVLTYHRFAETRRDPFAVTPAMFRRQMAWLRSAGLALSLDDLLAGLGGKQPLKPGGVLVTIDDGLSSTIEIAAPILAEHGVAAVAFLTPARIGQGEPDGAERFMGWPEARRLTDYGIVVGAHGWTHVSMARLQPAGIERQALRSKQDLEEGLGCPVAAYAYPFGTRADYSTATRKALAKAGYSVAFTSQHGAIGSQSDPLELPRIKIEGGEGMATFAAAVAGGLDGWSVVDRLLWRLQASQPGA